MPDREKLLKGLKCCIKSDRGCFCPDDCPYDDNDEDYCETLIKLDALSLLKEQPEIVLCKDCKYGVKSPTFQYYPEVTWCNKHSTSHNDEWFCADGEKESR